MAFDPDFFERLTKYLRSKGHMYYGCQPGIETGCTKTIGEIMHGKALPFSSEEYPAKILLKKVTHHGLQFHHNH